MSTLALFWSKNNPGEGRAPGARRLRGPAHPLGDSLGSAGQSIWTNEGLEAHLGWGERGPVSKFTPHLTSPSIPAAPSAPNLATSSTYSQSSHGGHAQWCWGMRGDQAEQGAAGGWTLDLGHTGILTPLPLAFSSSPFLISQASTELPQHPRAQPLSLPGWPFIPTSPESRGGGACRGVAWVYQGCLGRSVPGREGKLRHPGWARNATASSEHP